MTRGEERQADPAPRREGEPRDPIDPEAPTAASPTPGDHETPNAPPPKLRWELGGLGVAGLTDAMRDAGILDDFDELGSTDAALETAPLAIQEAADDPDRRIGRYVLLDQLGAGGMGVVHKAWDAKLHRIVAVKTILPHLDAGQTILARFQREAEAAAKLQHPAIVGILDAGEDAGRPYFAMPFIEGSSLRGLLQKRGAEGAPPTPIPLPDPRLAAATMRAVAMAVDHAHSHGIIHRDLKPDNILIDREGRPHVTDFGIALVEAEVRRKGAASLTATGQAVGTPAYMSPEQIQDAHHVDARADVYGLGMILYECLTGKLPFLASSANPLEIYARIVSEVPPAPSTIDAAIARDLDTICLKCLEKSPAARYRSASELASDLARWLGGEPILARPVSPAGRAWRTAKRHRAKLAVALIIAGVAGSSVLAAGWVAGRRQRAEAIEQAKALLEESPREALAVLEAGGVDGGAALETVRERVREADARAERRARAEAILAAIPPGSDAETVIALVTKAIEIDPTHERAWLRRGTAYYTLASRTSSRSEATSMGRRAVQSYSEAIRLAPSLPEAYRQRADVELGVLDDIGAALADYKHAAKLAPETWGGLAARALIAEERGELQIADDLYTRSLHLNPTFATALSARARVRLFLGRPKDALEDADRALEIDPYKLEAHQARPIALEQLGRVIEASDAHDRGVMLFPGATNLRLNRAILRNRLGRFGSALEDIDDLIERGHHSPMVMHARGKALHGLRRHDEAIRALTEALEAEEDHASARILRALAHVELGQLDEAMADFDRVIADPRASPAPRDQTTSEDRTITFGPGVSDAAARKRLGDAHHHKGLILAARHELRAADAELTLALQSLPDEPAVHANRGQIRERLGDLPGAAADYERFLALESSGRRASHVRKRLRRVRLGMANENGGEKR